MDMRFKLMSARENMINAMRSLEHANMWLLECGESFINTTNEIEKTIDDLDSAQSLIAGNLENK